MKHHRNLSRQPQPAAIGPGITPIVQFLLLISKGRLSKFLGPF
jgi:hypothetical protein